MNNNDAITKLTKRLQELEEENAYLREENANLKKELELSGINTSDSDEPVTLTNYYLKKYLDINEDVLKERVTKIVNAKASLQDEYNKLMEQEESLDVIANANLEATAQIEEITKLLEKKYLVQEERRFNFNACLREIEEKTTQAEEITKALMQEVINLLYASDNVDEVMSLVDQAIIKLQTQMYPSNVKIAEDKRQMVEKLHELNQAEQSLQVESKSLIAKKKSIEESLQVLSLETVETMLDQIVVEIDKQTKLEDELYRLFKSMKEHHLKLIVDEIKHYQVLELTNRDIAFEMDKVLKEYEEELRVLDTSSNIVMRKTMELSELVAKKAAMEDLRDEYTKALDAYQHLQSVYENINQSITKMEDYLNMATKAISTNPNYLSFVGKYQELLADQGALEKELASTNMELKDLKETRRLKVLDPYARKAINELTEKIKAQELNIEKLQIAKAETDNQINNLNLDKEKLKLINILSNKKVIENKLPSLYNQQHELMLAVDDKYQQLKSLEDELQDYEEISNRIVEIENEINH